MKDVGTQTGSQLRIRAGERRGGRNVFVHIVRSESKKIGEDRDRVG